MSFCDASETNLRTDIDATVFARLLMPFDRGKYATDMNSPTPTLVDHEQTRTLARVGFPQLSGYKSVDVMPAKNVGIFDIWEKQPSEAESEPPGLFRRFIRLPFQPKRSAPKYPSTQYRSSCFSWPIV